MSQPEASGAPPASCGRARHLRVLVVTNLWPTDADLSYGAAIRAQMESLRPFGVDYDVVFVNGRASQMNYLRGIFEVRRRVAGGQYDLIYAHFGLSGWVARFQWKVPVVVKFMGDDVLGEFDWQGGITLKGRAYQISSFVLARWVEGVIVISEAMKHTLRLKTAQVATVGVNLDLFKPMDRIEARRTLGLDPAKKYVLFPYDPTIARKRFDLVQEAVRLARAEVPALEILQVTGVSQERMPVYFNAADVFALVSECESGPNTVKEAMAVNLPVIAVDVGDVVEALGDAEGNYIVPRDAAAVAEKLVEVCRHLVPSRGRERLGQHSIQGMARKVISVFDGVLPRLPEGAPGEHERVNPAK
jgi:glycosyltransferase involved in cell wall biosynthesis